MTLLIKVKTALRISGSNEAFDSEITDLIAAARDDLALSGVSRIKTDATDPDPLIERAIKTYCKAHFGFDNPDADRLHDSYVLLKQHLTLAGDYREPVE